MTAPASTASGRQRVTRDGSDWGSGSAVTQAQAEARSCSERRTKPRSHRWSYYRKRVASVGIFYVFTLRAPCSPVRPVAAARPGVALRAMTGRAFLRRTVPGLASGIALLITAAACAAPVAEPRQPVPAALSGRLWSRTTLPARRRTRTARPSAISAPRPRRPGRAPGGRSLRGNRAVAGGARDLAGRQPGVPAAGPRVHAGTGAGPADRTCCARARRPTATTRASTASRSCAIGRRRMRDGDTGHG